MTCRDLQSQELARGAEVAVVTEEAIRGNDLRACRPDYRSAALVGFPVVRLTAMAAVQTQPPRPSRRGFPAM
jgi:hypothetical protein